MSLVKEHYIMTKGKWCCTVFVSKGKKYRMMYYCVHIMTICLYSCACGKLVKHRGDGRCRMIKIRYGHNEKTNTTYELVLYCGAVWLNINSNFSMQRYFVVSTVSAPTVQNVDRIELKTINGFSYHFIKTNYYICINELVCRSGY